MPTNFVRRLFALPLNRLALAIGTRIERNRDSIALATRPGFATDAPGLVIQSPFTVRHPERIHLGRDVKIGPNSILKLMTSYPGNWSRNPDGEHVEQSFDPHLYIGDRVTVRVALQITVYDRVTIEDDVLFASNVYISDGSHAVTRGDRPYKYQGIERVAPVHVGRGSWIGQNVVILPGVSIGAFSVVGANSVVTSDVPSGSVVVGAPARAVRRWDPQRESWFRMGRDEAASDDGSGDRAVQQVPARDASAT